MSKLEVTITDAFEQGMKRALEEVLEQLEKDPSWTKEWIKLKLEYFQMIEDFKRNSND